VPGNRILPLANPAISGAVAAVHFCRSRDDLETCGQGRLCGLDGFGCGACGAATSWLASHLGNLAADRPGHFWERHPVALEATDGARSISRLVTPSIGSNNNFAGGAVVLPDRTALFISVRTSWAKPIGTDSQVQLFAFSPSIRSCSRTRCCEKRSDASFMLHLSWCRIGYQQIPWPPLCGMG